MSLATLGTTLPASDSHFGIRMGAACPTGDLKETFGGAPILQFSVLGYLDLRHGHGVRCYLDRLKSGDSSVDAKGLAPILRGPEIQGVFSRNLQNTATVSSWTFGVDYLHYLSGRCTSGPYVFLGAGASSMSLQVSRSWAYATPLDLNYQRATYTAGRSRLRPYANAGFGYQLTREFGVEASYRLSSMGSGQSQTRLSSGLDPLIDPPSVSLIWNSYRLSYFTLSGICRF